MKLDSKLNLVVPILDDEERPVAYVHAAPISREVFESFFVILSKTFSAIYGEGLGEIAGPRVALMVMKKIATDAGMWEEVQGGLVAEMRRLANFVGPGPNGWEAIPLEDALRRKLISEDDAAEVENAVAFFTVNYAMLKKSTAKQVLAGAAKLWGARLESSNSTEFAAFLTTSTAGATSPPPVEAQAPPPAATGSQIPH